MKSGLNLNFHVEASCVPVIWLHDNPTGREVSILLDNEGVYHSEGVDLDQKECALAISALLSTQGNIDRAIENAKHAKLNKTVAALEKVKDATRKGEAR